MFTITAGTLELKLEIVPVESLLLHEKTLPHVIKQLSFEFKNWANLQNPIIVNDDNIVLDGNHRAGVFKALKFNYIPVCKIDYFNDGVKLGYWFRLIRNLKDLAFFLDLVKGEKGNVRRFSSEKELRDDLMNNPYRFGLQHGNYYASVNISRDILGDAVDAYGILEKIQEYLKERNIEMEYIPDQYLSDKKFCSGLSPRDLIIWTPHISKEMVVDAAKQEKIFSPKSTRHLIPARPLNVNVPTNWFKETIGLDEINERFEIFLQGKALRRFPPEQVINGRYYQEEIYFFYEKK
ncbi:MAG: hypothetical protein ACFFCS_01400 [Candidatus Hodarchaeota archaeon]